MIGYESFLMNMRRAGQRPLNLLGTVPLYFGCLFLALFGILVPPIVAAPAAISPTELRCEYGKNPIGIDVVTPHLSWVLASTERDEKQSAYEIVVASNPEILRTDHGDIWNSGKVDSDESIQIPFRGKTLQSGERCYWKVPRMG